MKKISKDDCRKALAWVYMILMAFLILWYLYSMATFINQYHTPVWIIVLRCSAAVLAVFLGRLYKDRGFQFLAALYILMIIRLLFTDHAEGFASSSVQESLYLGIWLFGACYGLAHVLSRKQLRVFLIAIGSIWTIGMVLYSLVGFYSAWTDQRIYTIGGNASWFIYAGRLNLIFAVNTAGSLLCVSGLGAYCLMQILQKKWQKLLLIPAILIIFFAICLTDARTSKISFAIGIGAAVGYQLFRHVRKNREEKILPWLAGGFGSLVVMAGILLLSNQFIVLFNQAKVQGGLLIPSAKAEALSAGTETLSHRWTNEGGLLFSGREEVWSNVLGFLSQNPRYLLYGVSIFDPMSGPNTFGGTAYMHTHCTPMLILLESGIPGLLLAGGFLFVLIKRGIGLIRLKTGPYTKGYEFFSFLVLSVLIGEIIECFMVLLRHYSPQQSLVFMVMGIICAYGRSKKSGTNTRSIEGDVIDE